MTLFLKKIICFIALKSGAGEKLANNQDVSHRWYCQKKDENCPSRFFDRVGVVWFYNISSQNSLHYMLFHIGQTITPVLKFEGQLLMVDAHQMQQSGLKIMHMNRILGNIITKIVRFASKPMRPNHLPFWVENYAYPIF